MSKIIVIGAGAMGTAFAVPCLDNNHDINIIGTHLEDNFIDQVKLNKRLHPGLNSTISEIGRRQRRRCDDELSMSMSISEIICVTLAG